MQTLRRYAWPDQNDVFMPESQHVMAVLKDIGDEIEQSRPRLKPAIDAGLTVRHRAELDWLQSEFGVEFHHDTDLRYARARRTGLDIDRPRRDPRRRPYGDRPDDGAAAQGAGDAGRRAARTARKPGRSSRRQTDTPRRAG